MPSMVKGIFGKVFMKSKVHDSAQDQSPATDGANSNNKPPVQSSGEGDVMPTADGRRFQVIPANAIEQASDLEFRLPPIKSNGATGPHLDAEGSKLLSAEENGGFGSSFRESFRNHHSTNKVDALYEEKSLGNVFGGYTTPGPLEREISKQRKGGGGHGSGAANLGVLLGVYLPTIQHILGVTLFIRLAWCVGVAGIGQTFLMLFICCFCTFLTCISVSAVATNGEVQSGGAYFMISRNLGKEFGSAVGILFYLANTVATAMYLVGGVEILLLYIFPGLTIGGHEAHTDTGPFGAMSNNLRIYATILIIIEFLIVAMGVKFVQMLAPVSLVCVICSILACYAGGIEKTLNPDAGQRICMIDHHLLQAKAFMPEGESMSNVCLYCNASNPMLLDALSCKNSTCTDDPVKAELFERLDHIRCVNGFPGFGHDNLLKNLDVDYPKTNEYTHGKPADTKTEIFQDVNTSFFLILAIYFPAVTGILTGTNMSGDLANPQKSIPAGTIAAQLTTSFIYFSLALVFGWAINPELLRDKYGQSLNGGMVAASLAWPSDWVLLIGSFLSTFGAALQCLCSAPRLLQSIAKDDVIPILAPFAKVTKNNEPFYGLIITTIIAELGILMGAMDSIAAVVDFFFLMCYAFVNIVCAMHSILGAPNWRPRYKYYHWSLALLGAALCFFIMFSTHWDYAIISLLLCLIIYKYVEFKGAKTEWGDGFRGLALSTAQYSIMRIDENATAKNWRPQLLLLHSMPWSEDQMDLRFNNLCHLASQLKAGKGLTLVVSFVRGDSCLQKDCDNATKIRERMEFIMRDTNIKGFPKVVLYNENQIRGCVNTLIQSVGIGGLKPNTLMLSWPITDSSEDGAASMEYNTFIDKLLVGSAHGMALIVAKGITDFPNRKLPSLQHGSKVDVYWIIKDGGLCVLIAYLLKQNRVWRNCKLRIIAVAGLHENNVQIKAELQDYLYKLRVKADILVAEISNFEESKEVFQRTLQMEERTRLIRQVKEGTISTSSMESSRRNSEAGRSTTSESENGKKDGDDDEKPHNELGVNDIDKKFKALDRTKVSKMRTSMRINALIKENSSDSQLVLITLPRPPREEDEAERLASADNYYQYISEMSRGVRRMLMIRNSLGNDVITTDA
ncbi:Amino acid permease/ SLC12A domain-containing protein [Aphelenchoides besseyi]|nr:Amino acid permease/ SLC12A domain-containing protein [Aphelenchoides besseyi]